MTKDEFVKYVVEAISRRDSFQASDFAAEGRAAQLTPPVFARAMWEAVECVRKDHRIVFVAKGDGSGTKVRAVGAPKIRKHAHGQSRAAVRKGLRAVDKMEVAIEQSSPQETASLMRSQARISVQFQRDRPASADLRREADSLIERLRVAAVSEARSAFRVISAQDEAVEAEVEDAHLKSLRANR